MKIINVVKFFYIIFLIYALMVMNVTSLNFLDIYPALLILFVNYIFFYIGYSLKKDKFYCSKYTYINKNYMYLYNLKYKYLFILAFFAVVFSSMAMNYYTGQNPIDLYNNLIGGKSVYNQYQEYFVEQNIQILSVDKIIYIFMLFYVKFIFFYSYISFIIYKKQINKIDKFYLAVITISFLYVGVARGTSFEFFEFILLCIFILLKKSVENRRIISNIIKILLLILIMIGIFYIGISLRGMIFTYFISDDVVYDYNSFLATISPILGYIIVILYGYFGFGFYYISTYISNIWIVSLESFFLGLYPLGFFSIESLSINDEIGKIIDIGVKWQPDTILIINKFGYLILLIYVFLLGFFGKMFEVFNKNEISSLSQFIIVILMISLPIGNFIFSSSSSLLILGLLILYWCIYFIKLKI